MLRSIVLVLVWAAASTSPLSAAEIRAVGVLGNSGQAGATLLRVATWPDNQNPTGVAVGPDCTLWLGAGDAIHRISLSGELLERFGLEPAGSRVDSRTFAVLDGVLYFLGTVPKRGEALFALPMGQPGAKARALGVELPKRKRQHVPYVLAPQPVEGKLVIVAEPPGDGPPEAYYLDPARGRIAKAFVLPPGIPCGAAYDARARRLYVGEGTITAVRPGDGAVCDGFPVPCMKTPAIPTQFRGTISLAAGAIWDAAWYGFLSRHGLDGSGDPGRVIEWHHELDTPTQVADLGCTNGRLDPLVITTATPAALYYAHWDRVARRLVLVRRLGCLPDIVSLGLSRDGWVTAGTARCQLWWRWADAADAPPAKADLHIAVTTPFFGEDAFFAVAEQYRLGNRSDRVAAVFPAAVGDRNEARRWPGKLPCPKPAGQAVRVQPGSDRGELFLSDADTGVIWRGGLGLGDLSPEGSWQPLSVEGTELKSPGDLAALTDGRLLVAEAGRAVLLEPAGKAFRLAWELAKWGDAPDEHFGQSLRLAVDGPWMLVADTRRHRVVWLDWTQRKVIGQFGQTDRPGDDLTHLSSPTFVSLRGTRAVVADSSNQRILKLVLAP